MSDSWGQEDRREELSPALASGAYTAVDWAAGLHWEKQGWDMCTQHICNQFLKRKPWESLWIPGLQQEKLENWPATEWKCSSLTSQTRSSQPWPCLLYFVSLHKPNNHAGRVKKKPCSQGRASGQSALPTPENRSWFPFPSIRVSQTFLSPIS